MSDADVFELYHKLVESNNDAMFALAAAYAIHTAPNRQEAFEALCEARLAALHSPVYWALIRQLEDKRVGLTEINQSLGVLSEELDILDFAAVITIVRSRRGKEIVEVFELDISWPMVLQPAETSYPYHN